MSKTYRLAIQSEQLSIITHAISIPVSDHVKSIEEISYTQNDKHKGTYEISPTNIIHSFVIYLNS